VSRETTVRVTASPLTSCAVAMSVSSGHAEARRNVMVLRRGHSTDNVIMGCRDLKTGRRHCLRRRFASWRLPE
jgi:hypothetical protein